MVMIVFVNVDTHITDILIHSHHFLVRKLCSPLVVNTVRVTFLCRKKKMKNPCRKCIVKPMCTQICPPKQNYEKLIKSGYSQYAKVVMSKNGNYKNRYKHKAIPKGYKEKFKHYSTLMDENRADIILIMTRNRTLLS